MASSNIFAQGFDWQNNARLPMTFPDWYLGIVVQGNLSDHHGEVAFIEANTLCCPYDGGTGAKILFGVSAEKWTNGNFAGNVSLAFSYENIEFSAKESIPVEPGKFWDTEFVSAIAISTINLDMGIKYRLMETKFSLGFGIDASLLIGNNQKHKEVSLSPDYPFADGSFEFIITDGKLPDLNIFQIVPTANLSYDIDMGYPNYATISTGVNYPLFELADNWRREYLTVSFIYYFGMF